MNAKSLQKRIDMVLRRVGGMDKTAYIRTFTDSGDSLTGRDTATSTDTILNPQPAYNNLTTRDVIVLTANNKKVSAEDYRFTFTGTSISESVITDPSTQIVLKSSDGSDEEVLRIIDFNSKGFQGLTLVWSVIARTV